MPERLGLVAVAALVAATPVSAQLKPSSPQAVAGAAVDCWQALGAGLVNEATLRSRGWAAGSFLKDKKPVASPVRVFAKAGSNVILLVMPSGTKASCAIISRMNSAAEVSQTADVLLARLKAVDPGIKAGRQGKGIAFASGPRVALLEGTGSGAQIGARILVAYGASEKQ